MIKYISFCILFIIMFVPISHGEDLSSSQKKAIIEETVKEVSEEAAEDIKEGVKAATKEVAEEIKKELKEESVQKVAEELAQAAQETQTVQKGLQVTRPLQHRGPTKVGVTFYVLDLDTVDTATQNFEANIYYEFTWHDPRLAGLYPEKVRKPLKDVWNPQIQFINQQRIWTTFPELVDIYPSGKVVYKQRAWGSFSQPLDLRDFPFDKQSFDIVMISAGHSADEVELFKTEDPRNGIAPKFSVADWRIAGWEAQNAPSAIGGDKEGALRLYVMSIKASRAWGYFVMQIVIPLIFIVLMSWSVFWIDPSLPGTQITVATTAMLTLIAFRFMAGITLPRIDYFTRLDYFILTSTTLVFLALFEVIISSWLARKKLLTMARRLDKFSRLFFPLSFIFATLATLVFRF